MCTLVHGFRFILSLGKPMLSPKDSVALVTFFSVGCSPAAPGLTRVGRCHLQGPGFQQALASLYLC